MLDWRTVLLGVFAFAATFAGGWWIGIGTGSPEATQSAAGTARAAAPASPSPAPAKTTYTGKGLTDDDRLRRVVILRSAAYQKPSCDGDPKTLYIMAATEYAETLMRAAGCGGFPKCRVGIGQLEEVWRLNRSALDQPVAEAMAAAHAAGGLTQKDFRGDVGNAARVIAGREFAGGPPPECESTRSSRWRVRVRR